MSKIKIMFDSNVFDSIILNNKNIDLLVGTLNRYEYYLISIQYDELNEVPSLDKKKEFFDIIKKLNMSTVYTSPAIYGKVKYGKTKYGGDKTAFKKVIFKSGTNINDALIASSAIREECVVITNDKDFYRKMKNNDYRVMTFTEFMDTL